MRLIDADALKDALKVPMIMVEGKPYVDYALVLNAINEQICSGGDDGRIGWLDIKALNLSKRSYGCLHRNGYVQIRDLMYITEEDLSRLAGCGEKSVREIMEKIEGLRSLWW